ncbi:MAG TPA: polysaccharide deacetylase family protein [Thermoanaerobaculia bacterium]|nr:polysaccharide deacetylase family protein [Thermoanaerobaculia bacterium]
MTSRSLQAAVLFSLLVALPAFAHADDGGPTVLCYHIVESPSDPRMEISREQFRQQMRYLAVTGYNVIPLKHAYEYATGQRTSLPPRSIVITIDDGWRSTYTEVFPEMKRRHFPFTLFIYPKIVGQTAHALTWKQIKEMAEWGADIQSHSFSHPFLTKRRHSGVDDRQYAEWLRHELLDSRKTLERETGKPVEFLAYPYGDYDHFLAAAVVRSGYLGALTCEYGRIRRGSDPLRMKRLVIEKRIDFASFRHYLGANAMPLQAVAPLPNQPLDPGLVPLTVSAKIPNYKNVDPKSVGLALMSSAGAMVPFAYDPQDGSITMTIKEALKGIQRAIVWATDTKSGKRLEATWVFKLSEPAPPPAARPAATPAPASAAPATTPVTGGAGASGASHESAALHVPVERVPKP